MLELCLRLELLKLTLIFYSLRITFFFFKFVISKFLQIFCCLHFSLTFHIFLVFSQQKLPVRKIQNQKKRVVWGGGGGNLIQLFNAFTKLCYFYSSNKNESKLYFDIIQKNICDFFSSCIIICISVWSMLLNKYGIEN
jgi:hypothetical protein